MGRRCKSFFTSAWGVVVSCGWRWYNELHNHFALTNNLALLDLGCGCGWHYKYAADHGTAKMLGIDLSEKMPAEVAAYDAAGAGEEGQPAGIAGFSTL